MPNLENTVVNKNLFQMMGCNQWSKTLTQSFVFWWSTYSIFSLVFPSLMYVHGVSDDGLQPVVKYINTIIRLLMEYIFHIFAGISLINVRSWCEMWI